MNDENVNCLMNNKIRSERKVSDGIFRHGVLNIILVYVKVV